MTTNKTKTSGRGYPIAEAPAEAGSSARALALLVDVSGELAAGQELAGSLQAVLEALERHLGASGGIVLVDSLGDGPRVEVYSDPMRDAPDLRSGGIAEVIATVVDTGEVAVRAGPVERPGVAAGDTRSDGDLALIGAPIAVNGRPVGGLALELFIGSEQDVDAITAAIRVVAGMVGQAVRASWSAELERLALMEENTLLREELRERYECAGLIGGSGPMRHLYAQVTQVAHTRATVMIRGESGTGKELIARAVHLRSPRAAKPFVTVNCSALPPTLVESELFGHEKGAFTGALGRKIGLFERANGGTLFLDEIGDLDVGLQAKLLGVLEEREIQRIGGMSPIPVDVRVIAATHRDLEAAIADGRFREDLYYRLNVFSIFAPPLRDRKTDVLALAEHFIQKYAQEYGKEIRRISTPAIDVLASYHWPGNVRELENVIVRAVLVCDGPVIHGHHLPPMLQTAESSDTVLEGSLTDIVGNFERNVIEDTLKTTGGNKMKAARILRTTQRILNYRIQRYEIDCERFRR